MAYNAAIGEMMEELKEKSLDRFRIRNNKLLNNFIRIPLALGFLVAFCSIATHYYEYHVFWYKLTSPLYSHGVFNFIYKFAKRIGFLIGNNPIHKLDILPIIVGYGVAILGSVVLSRHTAFRHVATIEAAFLYRGYVDAEGKPWKVTWTPDALMITAYNCDPNALINKMEFWNTISFPPSPPRIFKNNMNKFIVTRSYELPQAIIFEIKEVSNNG